MIALPMAAIFVRTVYLSLENCIYAREELKTLVSPLAASRGATSPITIFPDHPREETKRD
jgi:hypothetical protein